MVLRLRLSSLYPAGRQRSTAFSITVKILVGYVEVGATFRGVMEKCENAHACSARASAAMFRLSDVRWRCGAVRSKGGRVNIACIAVVV